MLDTSIVRNTPPNDFAEKEEYHIPLPDVIIIAPNISDTKNNSGELSLMINTMDLIF